MKTGILGLPGSGKSTLFDLLTEGTGAPDPAHPPNKPRLRSVKVHDQRLERLREDFQPKKYVPASLEVLDFPAVEGGERDRAGLADLLAPAREMDTLILVVRDFTHPAVPDGDKVDPVRDFQHVMGELVLSDLVIIERRLEKLAEKSRKPIFSEEERNERTLLGQVKARLEKGDLGVFAEMHLEDRKRLSGFGFLSPKSHVTVLNGETGTVPDDLLCALRNASGGEVLVVAARSELEILQLPEADRAVFLEEYGIKEFMRDPLIRAVYRAAGRISFFTAMEKKEVHAWTIRDGDTALQAAGTVHSDFERGFIRAEVVAYDDYVKYGGVKGAKEKGHYRLEGREYIVKDADIIEFRFSV